MSNQRIQIGVASYVVARTPRSQNGKSNFTATSVIPSTISLQGKVPNDTDVLGTIGFRFGTTDRNPGEVSNVPDGFVVLNQTTGNAFQSIDGKWCALGSDLDSVNPTLLDRWFSTTPTYAQWGATVGGNEIANEMGYCIVTSDRQIGGVSDAPENFLVYNITNGNTFKSVGGVWT